MTSTSILMKQQYIIKQVKFLSGLAYGISPTWTDTENRFSDESKTNKQTNKQTNRVFFIWPDVGLLVSTVDVACRPLPWQRSHCLDNAVFLVKVFCYHPLCSVFRQREYIPGVGNMTCRNADRAEQNQLVSISTCHVYVTTFASPRR